MKPTGLGSQLNVESPCCFSNLLQQGFIEAGANRLPRRVAHQPRRSVGIPQGNHRAGGSSHAHGENANPFLSRLPCKLQCVAFSFLSVGEDNEGFVTLTSSHRSDGFLDRASEVCATPGNGVGVEGFDGLTEGIVINRQRALEKCSTRKSNQSHAVAVEFFECVENGQFGPGQTVGTHVRGEHAPGGVHGEHDVVTPAFCLLPCVTGLWPGQGGEKQDDGGDDQPLFGAAPGGRDTGG